jgi:hypothetical protein
MIRASTRTQSLFHSGVHSSSVALTKWFDQAFLLDADIEVMAVNPDPRLGTRSGATTALPPRP